MGVQRDLGADVRFVLGLSCITAIAIAGLPATAFAQDSADATKAGTLEEIIVTAQKREESEQRTPIAIAVLSADDIARNGIGNLQDAITLLPSVSYGRNFANSIVTIRGVSSRDTDETGDPAIAISIDGFYFQRSLGINDSTFDLERVEALRGPQGTLYGRSATGGAINFVTAKPEKEFGAYAGMTVGNYNTIQTEGMLNVPLSDKVQMRASFFTRQHDGYRNNAPARNGDDADVQGARVHFAFQPMENLSALLTAELVTSGGVGSSIYGYPLAFTDSSGVSHERPPMPKDNQTWPLGNPTGALDMETRSLRWNIAYDFDWATLTYLGGVRKLDFKAFLDLDGLENHTGQFGDNAYFWPQSEKPETWNHEIRLTSKPGEVLDWQVGAYYFEETNSVLSNFSYFNGTNDPFHAFIFTYPDLGADSQAIFGQVGYHVTDEVTLVGGLRYSKDHKWRKGTANYAAFDFIIPSDSDDDWSKTTWHLGMNWQATDSNLLYAKAATGYKPGGTTDLAPYGPETLTSFEIGSKNRFRDDAMELNVAAFYYDYSDQQVLQFVGTQTSIQNAGKSELYGLEIEGAAFVTPNDRIDGYLAYLSAEYTEFEAAIGGENVDLAGNSLPQAPEFSANLGYEHVFNLSSGDLTARVQTHYESDSHLQFYNYPSDKQESYTRSDAILSYAPSDGKWLVEAYVRNIEDELIITAAQEQPLLQAYIYQFAEPRTYGLRFRMNW